MHKTLQTIGAIILIVVTFLGKATAAEEKKYETKLTINAADLKELVAYVTQEKKGQPPTYSQSRVIKKTKTVVSIVRVNVPAIPDDLFITVVKEQSGPSILSLSWTQEDDERFYSTIIIDYNIDGAPDAVAFETKFKENFGPTNVSSPRVIEVSKENALLLFIPLLHDSLEFFRGK